MLNDVKHSHWVPEFYLNNFCDSNGKISIYDKQSRTKFKTIPENICKKKGLYNIPNIKDGLIIKLLRTNYRN